MEEQNITKRQDEWWRVQLAEPSKLSAWWHAACVHQFILLCLYIKLCTVDFNVMPFITTPVSLIFVNTIG